MEYLYTNLGSANQAIYSQYTTQPQYFFAGNRSTQTAFNLVRVGLNWHFNPFVGAPIVALFGPTLASRNGPWSPHDVVVARTDRCECLYQRQCRRTGAASGPGPCTAA